MCGTDLNSVAPVLGTFLVHPHNRVQGADCRRLLNGREPAKVSEISGPGPSTREEIRMLNRWVRTVTSTVGRGGHRVGQIIKTLLRPVRTTAALTSAAALDAVRPRSELVAENAGGRIVAGPVARDWARLVFGVLLD